MMLQCSRMNLLSNAGRTGEAYLQSAPAVTQALRVRPATGLSTREASKRSRNDGLNVIPSPSHRSPWWLFLDRFRDTLILFLIAAAATAALLGELVDAVIITVAIVLDAALSFAQIWRTERTLARLQDTSEPFTTVLREGRVKRLPASYLVMGDIIELRAGERVPADARLLNAHGLHVVEAPLTGESRDVAKHAGTLTSRTPLGSRYNMLYLGTTAVAGSGRAVVVATGTRTEYGKIAQMLKKQTSPPSPLRKALHRASLTIATAITLLVAAIGLAGLLLGQDIRTTAHTAITLVVSAIPEDLTIVLTVALTIGVVRLLRQHGAVRELSAGESLGAATVICTDKTGTLTQGTMTALALDFLQGQRLMATTPPRDAWQTLALTGFALASDAHRATPALPEYIGSATERTSLAFVEAQGLNQDQLQRQWRRLDTIPFSPQWKYRASLHNHPTQSTRVLFVTGAPEVLLEQSSHALDADSHATPLTAARRAELTRQLQSHAKQGERLLAVAVNRNVGTSELTHPDIRGLTLLGVLLIADPIRPDVRASLRETLDAGIAVKLVTGDYAATAQAIARNLGLTVTADATLIGDELTGMSDEALAQAVDHTVLFARISPLDKQRIIRALQTRGHIVAMTGDGVNDAVALKSADIGVAMGSGKDIAKDAADLVLLDDSFTTIVAAIREGRVIKDNVRKVIAFLLATNAAEVAIFLVSLVLQLPLPLLPSQILWINIVTDGTSDLALALEPRERNVMRRQPESPRQPLINRALGWHIITTGAIMTAGAISLYWYLLRYLALDLTYARTMVFTFLATSSLISTWSFRSLSEPLLRRGLWQNPWLFVSGGFSFALQLAAIYFAPLQRFFGTVPLDPWDWVVLVLASLVAVILIDARKLLPALRLSAHPTKLKTVNA